MKPKRRAYRYEVPKGVKPHLMPGCGRPAPGQELAVTSRGPEVVVAGNASGLLFLVRNLLGLPLHLNRLHGMHQHLRAGDELHPESRDMSLYVDDYDYVPPDRRTTAQRKRGLAGIRRINRKLLRVTQAALEDYTDHLAEAGITALSPSMHVSCGEARRYSSTISVDLLSEEEGEVNDVLSFHTFLEGACVFGVDELRRWLEARLSAREGGIAPPRRGQRTFSYTLPRNLGPGEFPSIRRPEGAKLRVAWEEAGWDTEDGIRWVQEVVVRGYSTGFIWLARHVVALALVVERCGRAREVVLDQTCGLEPGSARLVLRGWSSSVTAY